MNTKSYIFAGIIAAITTNAMATGENIIASKSYVDAQDALKQNNIPAKSTPTSYSNSSIVEATGASGTVTERKIFDHLVDWDTDPEGNSSLFSLNDYSDDEIDEIQSSIPTVGAVNDAIIVLENRTQMMIPASGYGVMDGGNRYNDHDPATDTESWLNTRVKGTGLVTKTSDDGFVGERKIFEASDVSGYHAQGLTQLQKDIQDISIPTVGAMMSAISSGATAALPTGTTGTVVTYNGTTNGVQQFTETAIASTATHNQQTGALTNGSDIANVTLVETEIATREAKMTCAGWPDGTTTYDAQHTDANCWLWRRN